MNKQEKKELQDKAVYHARQIHALITEQSGTFQVIIHHTSQSNLSYSYSVLLWFIDPKSGRVECSNLNYWLATYLGFGNLNKKHHLKGGGLGFDRIEWAIMRLARRIATVLEFEKFQDLEARFGVPVMNDFGYMYLRDNRVRGIY